jgi:hypothetical protein
MDHRSIPGTAAGQARALGRERPLPFHAPAALSLGWAQRLKDQLRASQSGRR